MPRLDLGSLKALPFQSCLFFGASRSGKTHLCATFPKVAMLCSQRERGYITVPNMDPKHWYEPLVPPQVFPVDTIGQLMTDLHKEILPQVRTGRVQTIVIELTFHADDAIRTMDIDEKNGWAKYMALEQHVNTLDAIVKKTPGVRVVYNTLAMPEDSVKGTSGVLIPGKALAKKIPALCDLSGYMQQEDCNDHTDRVLHLSAFGNYSPGHRYGDKLPSMIRNPTYRDLEDLYKGAARVSADGVVTREAPKLISVAKTPLPPIKK